MPEIATVESSYGAQVAGNVPASTAGTTLTANATASTKGTYVELVAATAYSASWVWISLSGASAAASYLVDIAVGSSTEQVIIPNLYVGSARVGGGGANYLFPVFIPAGTRIAARCQSSPGGATIEIVINLLSGTMLAGGSSGWVDEYGAVASSIGTNLDPGAVANTDSSWVQLTAATNRLHRWLAISGRFGDFGLGASTKWLLDIGIGSATEQEILSDLYFQGDATGDQPNNGYVVCIPVLIPAGSRLTARVRSSVTTDGDRDVNLKVYGC